MSFYKMSEVLIGLILQSKVKGESIVLDRFERFSNGIFRIVKIWQKIALEEMSQFGLSASHVIYLIALYKNTDGLTSQRLADLSEKDKSDVSRSLKSMLDGGLVEKHSNYQKGYAGIIFLTDKGKKVAEKIGQRVMMAVELANENVSDEKREIFYEVLETFAGNITKISERGISGLAEDRRKTEVLVGGKDN